MPPRRKSAATKAEPKDVVLTPKVSEGEILDDHAINPSDIVPEGDFAGMTYDEVLTACIDGVHDVYGNLSLDGVKAVHDMVGKELLELIRFSQGDYAAKDAALKLISTMLPYSMLDVSNDPNRPLTHEEALLQYAAKKRR